ncbi:hypothetical protein [Natrarchaeobaculum sulfurireducens]|uniref:Restriction endonuclease n=1 Tax=Natrarchaeobaculum sulfurireducens TaxID=2044521 RepID=A0A346PPJ9_9EURY|nr:hypothetical protein [Natrarchaeobaculum sulfurireducens]AXR81444.1 hypothetical protein AArcMg_1429 [Natrarchaeobaculum sulfurireducens]
MNDKNSERDLRNYLGSIAEFCAEIESRTVPEGKSSTSKQIGTYFEKELRVWFEDKHGLVSEGSVAKDLDLPAFNLDLKTTSNRQPQSSSTFDDPGERIVGVDYNILLIVYDKQPVDGGNKFEIMTCAYIPKERASDYRKSEDAVKLVADYRDGKLSEADLREQLENLTGVGAISDEKFKEIKESPPEKGAITITPALQWRFNYNKMVKKEVPEGTKRIYGSIGDQTTLPDTNE